MMWIAIIAGVLWATIILFGGHGSYIEPDEIEVHPTLEGKELDQWLKLYEGISIQYARSLLTAHGISEITWEQYGKLTGKEIWETVPNPDKVKETA